MADEDESVSKPKQKLKQAGIIYLSTIPPTMNVKTIRQLFSKFGQVDRIFLQPNPKAAKKANNYFTEGWVEFKSKKIAKSVAINLNNTQVGGKRRSKYYDSLWNIKYLNKFRWTHLNERLAYEKAVRNQRLRTEVAQVKKETNHFVKNVEKSKQLEKMEKRRKTEGKEWKETESIQIAQISTQEEIDDNKCKPDKTLLANIFSNS